MNARDTGAQVVDRRKNWEARVEMAVFKRPSNELSAYDKLVYAILCGHANRDGNAMLYVRTIAEEASCSERQARRALSALEARNLLIRRPQNIAGQGQTFNIYEVYGFDEYSFDENPAAGDGAEPPCQSDTTPLTDSQAPVCQSDIHPLPVSPAPHDSQAGLNNVFEQHLKNSSKKEQFPPAPQRGAEKGEISKPENPKPQRPKHDTEKKAEPPKPNEEMELFKTIREVYNSILPELPQAEKLTASRVKALRQRIRENPERQQPDWWKKFFSSVRKFPWPMGQNKDKWRADFDWLTGERGMQKILEGSFQKTPVIGECAIDSLEFQKKYTDSEGRIDARAMLRDIERSSAHRQFFS